VVVGLPEKPNPGSDGATTWKASAASPPWAVGSVSGSITLWNSTIEPGQPWETSSGIASGCGERAWTKWRPGSVSPSTGVVNWSNRLSAASRSRQSYPSAQYAHTSCT
jgi:hypothetical protein